MRQKVTRRTLLAAAALLCSAGRSTLAAAAQRGRPATVTPLKTLFACRFKIGMAVDPNDLRDEVTRDLVLRHANSVTAENVLKPHIIGAREGVYDFARGDALVAFCRRHAIAVRGHTLVWHQNAPDWFFRGDRSDPVAYRALVRRRLERYVTDVVTHYRGKVYVWDVVNEVASLKDGEVYRDSPWYRALGPDFIEYAFRAARAADPDVLLFINDFGTEEPAKRQRLLTIVKSLLAKGVPLDGVGHQLHMTTPTDPDGVDTALTAVEALGLKNQITELDVSFYKDPQSCYTDAAQCLPSLRRGSQEVGDQLGAQALLYGRLYRIFSRHPSVQAVTTWGAGDNGSWLSTFPTRRLDLPLIFDETGLPKPAYEAIRAASSTA